MKPVSGIASQAIDKWELEGVENQYRAGLAALMMDNQEQWFEEHGVAPLLVSEHEAYNAIKRAWLRHPLPDMVAVQPASSPLSKVAYYRPQYSAAANDGVPEILLDIAIDEIVVDSSPGARVAVAQNAELPIETILDMFFEEELTAAARDVLGAMLNSSISAGRVYVAFGPADLKNKLVMASSKVHRDTMRAPANRIVANQTMLAHLGLQLPPSNGQVQQVGIVDDKWTAFLDPLFPDGQLLAWYQGESLLDTGTIYSPFRTEFEQENGACRANTRRRITLARPEFSWVVRL